MTAIGISVANHTDCIYACLLRGKLFRGVSLLLSCTAWYVPITSTCHVYTSLSMCVYKKSVLSLLSGNGFFRNWSLHFCHSCNFRIENLNGLTPHFLCLWNGLNIWRYACASWWVSSIWTNYLTLYVDLLVYLWH